MITIVGLGTERGDLTQRGREAILSGGKVIVRTALAKSVESVKELGVEFISLDGVYERCRSFDTLRKKLAQAVLSEAEKGDVVYCVDGGVAEDRSAEILLKNRKGQKVKVVSGIGKAERALERANLAVGRYSAVSAYDYREIKEHTMTEVIYDLDDRFLAGEVKMQLSDLVGDEQKITFIHGEKSKKIYVYELDRQKDYDYTTAVVLPEIPLLEKKRFNIEDLKDIIVRLRRPDGCPWDKVQTPQSIRMNVVEEAYELVDAIDSGDPDKIREETGDVLLQAVFHAVMQEELGQFNLNDSLSELCQKLIFRHTHIFGKDKAADEASALSVWERNKAIEKKQDTFSKSVNDVPSVFPACMRAQKVQKRAGKSGFECKDVHEAAKKTEEKLAVWKGAYEQKDPTRVREELGELLFALVNVGRLSGVDCELALKEATDRFCRCFAATENLILADKKDMVSLSLEELNEYYEKAKKSLQE